MNLALNLFNALGRDYDEESISLFKRAYLDPTGMHISKAKEFVNSGEWDSKYKLQIRLITGSH